MRKSLRFGLHDFLNAQPLLASLSGDQKNSGIEVVRDTPSALAERFEAGEFDLAMIPAVAFFKLSPGHRLLDGICIASDGKVDTVLFAASAPLSSLKSIAFDRRSRTSIALLQILFGDRFAADVVYEPFAPDPEAMLESRQAGLIIGDQAFRISRLQADLQVFDLSEAWFDRTGLPFVHAVIAVREGVALDPQLRERIVDAPEAGLKRMDSYLPAYAQQQGLDKDVCERYLRQRIRYRLGKKEVEGLLRFQGMCVERGLVPEKTPIEFV